MWQGCPKMEKDTVITPTPPLPKGPLRPETPVRAMSLARAQALIRKTAGDHAELFRRLAK